MPGLKRTALCIIGTLMSAWAVADGADNAETGRHSSNTEPRYIESLPPGPLALYGPLPYQPLPDVFYTRTLQPGPLGEFEFRDGSTYGRLSRLRSLSLVTLARGRQTRLFFGVNEDGIVGLHFSATQGAANENYLALVRMPYLKDEDAE